MRTALLVLEIICSIGLIISILLQSGNKAGLGVIGGAAETLMGNKARGLDVVLRKVTIAFTVLFLGLALALAIIK